MVNSVVVLLLSGTILAFAWPFSQIVKQTDKSSYPLAPNGTLTIHNASGDIRVDGYDGTTVRVVAHRQAASADVLAQVKVEATTAGGNVSIKSVYPSHCVNCEIAYEILMPRTAALAAEDSSGAIDVSAVGGDVNVITQSGDIGIHQAGGRVFVEAASGKITVEGAAGQLHAKTASGDVDISDATGNVEARASSGNVAARFAKFGSVREIRLDTASGDVMLAMPRNADAVISAETDAGSIQSDFGQAPHAGYAGATFAQTIGDGRVKVDVSVASGSIRLRAI